MPTVSVPFQDLAERIEQREAELTKLRQELESRRRQLSELTRRKEEIQAELAKIDKDIEAVGQTSVPAPTASAARTPAVTGGSKAAAKPSGQVSLPTYLVQLVGHAKGPITARELAEEVMRNKFPTTSKNVYALVQTRVHDLVRKGVLHRAGDSSGIVLAQAPLASKAVAAKAPVAARKKGKTKEASAKPTAVTTPVEAPKWRSLHEVLTHILAKSSQPLKAQELADRVTQSGYESKSKDLKNVIWVSIGKIPNVERVPGKGYRLKKGKVAGGGGKSQ